MILQGNRNTYTILWYIYFENNRYNCLYRC